VNRPFARGTTAALLVLLLAGSARAAETTADWRRQVAQVDPEFSQVPFWFWNDELANDEIRRQMADFREHGVHGFVIHARMGLPKSVAYMGPRWMEHVRFAVEEAARTGMRVCLYDEGMYPSGSAHGQVVRSNPAFAAQGLAVQSKDLTGPAEVQVTMPSEGRHVATILARRRDSRDGIELGTGQVTVVPGQRGTAFELSKVQVPAGPWRLMTFSMVPTGGHIRGVHPGEEGGQPGAPPAADLLNVEAMRAFVRFAYEPYREVLKGHFGKAAFAMFTDEPSLSGRGGRGGLQPWTEGLEDDFARRRGHALLPLLPALFYDCGPQTAKVREDFRLTLDERLDETYYQPLSRWCQEHGIALTGHPAGSDEIRPLRLFQVPGQDMVWRWVLPSHESALEGPNSTVAKCSSSVARHDARHRNANEIYGAYGWHLTMDEMKWLADWLMVRGVNLLYPHAFYYSIREERVHERPPDLGMHNAWWPHYRHFADYTSRVCKLMTDGQQVCEVAVLSVRNRLPWRAARWLLQNQVDFNYLEDWRLVSQARIERGTIRVGPMSYRLLIVDHDQPLGGELAEQVRQFEAAGGLVRTCGAKPGPELVAGLARDAALDPPSLDLRCAHLIKRSVHFYLLVNEGERPITTAVTCRALGKAEWYDPWRNEFRPAAVLKVDDAERAMTFLLRLQRRESVVLVVDPSQRPEVAPVAPSQSQAPATVALAGRWKIIDAQGAEVGSELGDWRRLPKLAGFAGTLRYQTTFALARQAGRRYELDLGTVGDWAVMRLNGKDLGPKFWSPITWDITEACRNGANELCVEATNSLANRYDPKSARPSGLFGPVTVRETRAE